MTERVRAAPAKWADYPVDRERRPIVLTGYTPQTADRLAADPRRRSVFDGPAVPESDLPAELLPVARWYCRDVHTGGAAAAGPHRPGGRSVRRRSRAPGTSGVDDIPGQSATAVHRHGPGRLAAGRTLGNWRDRF